MATVHAPAEQRFRLSLIDWNLYVTFTDGLGERPVRITYDQGEMELMTVSHEHERAKKMLARFVEAVTEEMDIDIASGGGMTFRREDLRRALEPDECYWVAHEAEVRGRDDFDPDTDPPPDLVIEVEISRSALDRMSIYATLGVPEVWRYDGAALRVCVLKQGRYVERERSPALPFLPMAEVVRFLQPAPGVSETQRVREFRAWVREQKAKGWRPPTRRKG